MGIFFIILGGIALLVVLFLLTREVIILRENLNDVKVDLRTYTKQSNESIINLRKYIDVVQFRLYHPEPKVGEIIDGKKVVSCELITHIDYREVIHYRVILFNCETNETTTKIIS